MDFFKKLSLRDYGNLCTRCECVIEDKLLVNMNYTDYKKGIKIEADKTKNNDETKGSKIFYNLLYLPEGAKRPNSKIHLKSDFSSKDIYNEFLIDSPPFLYNWTNSKNKTENGFNIKIELSSGIDSELFFEKGKNVVVKSCIDGTQVLYVFENNNDMVEYLVITNSGLIYSINYTQKCIETLLNNGTSTHYFDVKEIEPIGSSIFDYLPTRAIYMKNETENIFYEIEYDRNRMVSRVHNKNNNCVSQLNGKTISRYEALDKYESSNIFMLFYDAFDVEYSTNDGTYWAESKYDQGYYVRNVYKIDPDKLQSLSNELQANNDIPVISVE